MPRIRLQLAPLHLRDKVRQHGVGAAGNANLLALAHDKAVAAIDRGAPALLHVLAHRRALLGRGALAILEALLVASLHRGLVALAGARDGLRRQVQDFLELIALRLADTDGLAAEFCREAADRLALQHLPARETRAGRKPVAHDVGDEL